MGVWEVRTRSERTISAFSVPLDNAHILAVSLDGRPLVSATRILLQVMSEERPSGWRSAPATQGRMRVVETGGAPWEIRPLAGTVEIRRPDADAMTVRALDGSGPTGRLIGNARRIALEPGTIYYVLESPAGSGRGPN